VETKPLHPIANQITPKVLLCTQRDTVAYATKPHDQPEEEDGTVCPETKPRLGRDARNVLLYMSTPARARAKGSGQNAPSSKGG
jgi:hypothetical protein